MHITLFILPKIMITLPLIYFLIEIYKKTIENKLRHIEIKKLEIIYICEDMMADNNKSAIEVVQSVNGISSYIPSKNKIILKKTRKVDLFNLIIATHEVGHYVDFCGEGFITNIVQKSMLFIGINRFVVIPIFLVSFFMNIIFHDNFSLSLPGELTLFLAIIYYITSFIRILTCIPVESKANVIAFEYISKHKLTQKENFSLINSYYILSKYSQLVMALSYISIITIIIMVSVI